MNNIDFNFIFSAGHKCGLNIDESLHLAFLIGLTRGSPVRLRSDVLNDLINKNLIDTLSKPLPAGIRVFRKLKSDNMELSRKLRDMYPPGMKDGTWPWRGTVISIAERLSAFNKMYPDITDDEIVVATKDYINRFSEDGGRSLLMYFIWKSMPDGAKRSLLAEWVYANREMKGKQRTNTEQI